MRRGDVSHQELQMDRQTDKVSTDIRTHMQLQDKRVHACDLNTYTHTTRHKQKASNAQHQPPYHQRNVCAPPAPAAAAPKGIAQTNVSQLKEFLH